MAVSTVDFPNSVLSVARQLMTHDAELADVTMFRGFSERRSATQAELPYITEEGLVLFDRRESRPVGDS